MPAHLPRKGVISLSDTVGRMDATQRSLLADYCRLVGRRLRSADATRPMPADPAGSPQPVKSTGVDAVAAMGLPPRLAQTLSGLLIGQSEKQIALQLSISRHTVHTYVKDLHKRFGVSSRGELLARFIDTGSPL